METVTIRLEDWEDIVASRTANPVAESEFVALARAGKLLVGDGRATFLPVESDGSWALIEVANEQEIARALGVSLADAHRILVEGDVMPFADKTRLFDTQKLWRMDEFGTQLAAYTDRVGLTAREAALELGVTHDSFAPLLAGLPFAHEGRILKVLLEGFRNRLLPRDSIWTTRSSLLREFIAIHNARSGNQKLVAQECEADGCEQLASDRCTNEDCRSGCPRFVCPVHSSWVDIKNASRRPPSLCPECAKMVGAGTLHGFTLL